MRVVSGGRGAVRLALREARMHEQSETGEAVGDRLPVRRALP